MTWPSRTERQGCRRFREMPLVALARLPPVTGWSDSELGQGIAIALLVGCVLAQGAYCYAALRRPRSSTALLTGEKRQRGQLVAYLWFGLAGAHWVAMRTGWLPNASPVLPLVGVVMGLGTLVRPSLEAHAQT